MYNLFYGVLVAKTVAHKVKRADLIFNTDFIGVPLNFDIVETIFDKVSKNRIVFHVLNMDFLDVLVKKQRSNLSISCSRNKVIDPNKWSGPMDYHRDAGQNIVVKLKGFINYGSEMDLWTAPDEHGNRWITDLTGGFPEVSEGMQIVIDGLQAYKEAQFGHIGYGYTDLPKQQRLAMEEQFMNEAKNLLTKHRDALVREMGKVLRKQKVKYDVGESDYDEFVISNYKIECVAIPKKTSLDKKIIADAITKKHKLKIVDYSSTFFNLNGDGQ